MGLFKRLKEKQQLKKSIQSFQDKTNSFKTLKSVEIDNISDDSMIETVRSKVKQICEAFPTDFLRMEDQD